MKQVLTIAGSDSGGGAGIQADLKTFAALGVYGLSAITAVTAQNTLSVKAIENLTPEIVGKQIDLVFKDFNISAVKIGMVSNQEIITSIVERLKKWEAPNIILDPVMVSASGDYLLKEEARYSLINQLMPLATLITPNMFEAEVILNRKIKTINDLKKSARDIFKLINKPVVVKGGHFAGDAVDVFFDGSTLLKYSADRVNNKNNHGTGCTYSSAIAAYLARGDKLIDAIAKAKTYITGAINNGLNIGHGSGPTHHFYRLYDCLEE